MKYLLSPEFHRNLWLKFSPVRIVAAPLVLMLCAFIIVQKDEPHMDEALMGLAMTIYYVVVFLWGNYEAGGALQDEVKGKTWDQQKMSSITPAQLAFGKLFGATSYIWYFGLLALGLYLYAYLQYTPELRDGLEHLEKLAPQPEKHPFRVAAALLIAGVFGHAAALLASFSDMTSPRNKTVRNYIPSAKLPFLLGLAVSHGVYLWLQQIFLSPSALNGYRQVYKSPEHPTGIVPLDAAPQVTEWFNHSFARNDFILASIFFFAAWCMAGLYRIARSELMYNTAPSAWMAFAVSLALYCMGFNVGDNGGHLHGYLAVPAAVLFGLTYCAMGAEAADTQKYKRLATALRARNWRRALENTPKWLATLPLLLGTYLFWMGAVYIDPAAKPDEALKLFSFCTAILLFAARDTLVIHALYAFPGNRHIRFQQVLYYTLAYALLPMVQAATMQMDLGAAIDRLFDDGGAAAQKLLMYFAWYYPLPSADFARALLPVTAEAAVAAFLFLKVLKKK